MNNIQNVQNKFMEQYGEYFQDKMTVATQSYFKKMKTSIGASMDIAANFLFGVPLPSGGQIQIGADYTSIRATQIKKTLHNAGEPQLSDPLVIACMKQWESSKQDANLRPIEHSKPHKNLMDNYFEKFKAANAELSKVYAQTLETGSINWVQLDKHTKAANFATKEFLDECGFASLINLDTKSYQIEFKKHLHQRIEMHNQYANYFDNKPDPNAKTFREILQNVKEGLLGVAGKVLDRPLLSSRKENTL